MSNFDTEQKNDAIDLLITMLEDDLQATYKQAILCRQNIIEISAEEFKLQLDRLATLKNIFCHINFGKDLSSKSYNFIAEIQEENPSN